MRRLAFLFLSLLFGQAAFAVELNGVRSAREADRTRIVFDLSGAPEYRLFTMRQPDRLVIDFTRTRSQQPLALSTVPGSALRRLRHAVRGKDGLRVVLDLNRAVSFSEHKLAPGDGFGHRLVVDLQDTSKPLPATVHDVATLAAKPAAPPPTEGKVAARQRPLRDVVIAIDAGHGGADVGAIGPSGVYEKDITLAIAHDLAQRVDREPGMRAVLTRGNDRYLKLRERMERAREERADLFISIHADAFRDRRVKGSSVYVLSQSGASSEAAKWLADNENAADLIGGVSLDDKDHVLKSVLIDLSQTASIESSIDVGKQVLEALRRLGPVHKSRVQHAGFMVLKSPDIPSILVETAFISNPDEEKRLRNKQFRGKLADALFSGVAEYFEASPPPDTRLADNRRHKVIRGDTLSAIAHRYAVSVSSIKLANNLPNEMVRTGDVLTIP